MTGKNPYDVLGVTPDADEEVISAVYQSLVKKHHPDQGGDKERFKEINNAYETIQNHHDGHSSASNAGTSDFAEDIGSVFSLFETSIETESVTGHLSDGLVLAGDHLTIGLLNITEADISEYIPKHWPRDVETQNRLLLVTHVSNHSEYVQPFRPHKFRIISNDGRRYDVDNVTGIDAHAEDGKALPSNLHNEGREMEPHTAANFVSVVENTATQIYVDRVVYPFTLFDGHRTDGVEKAQTRYVFDIEPHHHEEFKQLSHGTAEHLSGDDVTDPSDHSSGHSELESESVGSSNSHSRTETSQNDVLSERDTERIADIIELDPTTNSELKDRWNMDSGSEVHQYLESTLSDFYVRRDDGMILATSNARRFIESLNG